MKMIIYELKLGWSPLISSGLCSISLWNFVSWHHRSFQNKVEHDAVVKILHSNITQKKQIFIAINQISDAFNPVFWHWMLSFWNMISEKKFLKYDFLADISKKMISEKKFLKYDF